MQDRNEHHKRTPAFEVLTTLSQRALVEQSLHDLLRYAVTAVADVLQVDYCGVRDLASTGERCLRASYTSSPAVAYAHQDAAVQGISLGEAQYQDAGPSTVPDEDDGYQASLVVSIEAHGTTFGDLEVANRSAREWTEDEQGFVRAAAGIMAGIFMHDRVTNNQRHSMYRTLIEHSTDAIVLFDTEGRIIYASPATKSVIGYSLDEFVNRQGQFFVHPDDLPALRREYLDLETKPNGTVTLECRIQHKERGWVWLEIIAKNLRGSNDINAMFVNVRDIHARKQAEEEHARLLDAAQHARRVAEEASEQVRRLQSLSDTALSHLELNELLDELLRRISEVLPADAAAVCLLDDDTDELMVRATIGLDPEDASATRILVGQGIAGRIAASRLPIIIDDMDEEQTPEAILRQANIRSLVGVPLMVDDYVSGVLYIGSGERFAYSPAALDLLERAAARASLGIKHAQLYAETQGALRVRHELLAVAAHELRTPIASLLGYAQLLQSRFQPVSTADERTVRALRVMTEQVHRLNRLVNRLLDLSRIENSTFVIQRESIDLVEVVRNVVDSVQTSLEMHRLDVHVPDAAVMVNGDALRLEQVVHNLLSDAIKYSPWGGIIDIDLVAEDDHAVLSVKDTGIGISPDDQTRLFQPFYRVKNSQKQFQGLGIGLYIVRETVEQHGGSVEVRSARGEGSTFIVRLPLLVLP